MSDAKKPVDSTSDKQKEQACYDCNRTPDRFGLCLWVLTRCETCNQDTCVTDGEESCGVFVDRNETAQCLKCKAVYCYDCSHLTPIGEVCVKYGKGGCTHKAPK